jgi:O-antigen/teichoic acid export membrane protein
MALALSIVGIFLGILLSNDQKVAALPLTICLMSLIPLALLTINNGMLMGFHQFKISAAIDASNGLAKFMIIFLPLFALGKLHLEQILALSTCATFIPLGLSYAFIIRRIQKPNYFSQGILNKKVMFNLLHYSKWVCLTDLLSSGLFLLANFILSTHSIEDLALFNIVVLLYSVFQIALGAITPVLIPQIADTAAKNHPIKVMGIREIIFLLIVASCLIGFIFVMPFKEYILTMIFGKTQYSDALTYVALLLISFPFRLATATNKGIVQGLNRPKSIAIASALTFGSAAVLFLLFYERYGLSGLITAFILSYFLEFILTYKAANREIRQARLNFPNEHPVPHELPTL